MRVGGIRTDNYDDVGRLHRVKVLSSGRGSERGFQAVARGGVAVACAGIDVVVAKSRSNHLLN